jgi:hypothetical protein
MAYNTALLLMIEKIRALTEDFVQSSTEVFTYETSGIFTLAEPRIVDITSTLINGAEPFSSQSATFDPLTNKITIFNEEAASGDIIEVTYTFSKYSDSELVEYIRAALIWLSIYDSSVESYKISPQGLIIPTVTAKQNDLICMIASVLIKPDYISYKTSTMSVTYPTKATKEDKIKDLIQTFTYGTGVIGIIEWDRTI